MKVLGLNIGISSVSFSLLTLDQHKGTIIANGIHLFEAAENPEDGSSLALPRRLARSARKIYKRRKKRLKDLINLLNSFGFSELEQVTIPSVISPWQLRAEGLKRELSHLELARCIYHIAKRRGFKSNRKQSLEDKQKEETIMLEQISILKEKFKSSPFKTIGEYFYNELKNGHKVRNDAGSFYHTIPRELLENEFQILMEFQSKYKEDLINPEFLKQISHVVFFQNPFKSFENKIGNCIYIPDQKRAAKNTHSAELFVFFSKLNGITITSKHGKEFLITEKMKKDLLQEAYRIKQLKLSHIRKLWKVPPEFKFKTMEVSKKSNPENKEFFSFKGYHVMNKVFEEHQEIWEKWEKEETLTTNLDKIITILAFNRDLVEIKYKLLELYEKELPETLIDKIKTISDFNKTISLSISACGKLIPYLMKGYRYDQAVKMAAFEQKKQVKSNKLPVLERTGNPVVDRAVSKTRKIVNAVLSRYGMPDEIHIKSSKELGKPFNIRRQIAIRNEKNRISNENIKQSSIDFFGRTPSAIELTKYKLWSEQNHKCCYSQKYISPTVLQDPTATEIDYILPFSRSYDDTLDNKVLCLSDENRKKGNRTPYEYLGGNEIRWTDFETFVLSLDIKERKSERLLKMEWNEDDWKNRYLTDLRYISKFLKYQIENHLNVKKVVCANNAIIQYLKNTWQINKCIEFDNRIMAVDSIALACCNQQIIDEMTKWSINRNDKDVQKPTPPKPWNSFNEDIVNSLGQIFISRTPNCKSSGKAHQETIKRIRIENNERKVIKRVPLSNVTLETLERIVDKERNKPLYFLIKERLEQHKNIPKNAFYEPLYNVRKDGEPSSRVNGIRVYDDSKSGLLIKNGIADNDKMVRLDIFEKPSASGKSQYYSRPVYVYNIAKKSLLEKCVAASKTEDEWLTLDESFKFCFSLYKHDLIRVVKGNGNELIGYYNGFNRWTASISILEHAALEQDYLRGKQQYIQYSGVGIKTLSLFEKYTINYFGERYKVKRNYLK